ncbi:uncharacterized protein [Antedon mediterranea]|uniref:uncharacterized protein n=1 Tax=Antedon mediterranea TaxID=105859 RepID=UPI003AF956BB
MENMFSFKIDSGRRLSDDWEPFKFSNERLRSRLRDRSKLFDDSWFKELPISRRLLDDKFPWDDDKEWKSKRLGKDVATEPLSSGQTVQLHRQSLFDDPWFKDFMDEEDSLFKTSECSKKSSAEALSAAAESKEVVSSENFQVTFEMGNFEAEEIEVTLDGDNLTIHGQKSTSGECREMFKYYKLPDNINTDALASSLSKDGLLKVTAPWKEAPPKEAVADYQVEIPLADFKPENIDVSLDGRRVKVHAKTSDENATTGEEVTRWFTLPDTASTDGLKSCIGDDGSIIIQLPFASGGGSLEISCGKEAKDDNK